MDKVGPAIDGFDGEDALDAALSEPTPELVALMGRLSGDVMVLGVAGKMGLTLARMAKTAADRAGVATRITGVSRFSRPGDREKLAARGVETIACDLLDREAVLRLPRAENVIFMAGRKFGTVGAESDTWAMNTLAPAIVADRFRGARVVVFSTGCVYPLVEPSSGGCDESQRPLPVGEYAQSCLGRERVFEDAAKRFGTRVLLFRLNYAIDLRYGVLHDLALKILADEPVDLSVGLVNILWQGDANDRALRALEFAANPPAILNVTGPETLSVERLARALARAMGKEARFTGSPGSRAYLADAGRANGLFGYPWVPAERLVRWQAAWCGRGGASLGKPTHFEVGNGEF